MFWLSLSFFHFTYFLDENDLSSFGGLLMYNIQIQRKIYSFPFNIT